MGSENFVCYEVEERWKWLKTFWVFGVEVVDWERACTQHPSGEKQERMSLCIYVLVLLVIFHVIFAYNTYNMHISCM